MGKRTDTFLWLKIQLSHTLLLCAKSYVAGRANNTELLMLVSDFKVNPRLKNTQRHFQWNSWNALNGDAYKKDTFCTLGGSHALLAISTNCLIAGMSFMDPILIL